MALIKADIIMARQGIELYKSNEIKEVKNQAAYHLQQAAEKMIKIQIYRSGVPYENKSLYVHNLNKSFPICRTISYYIEAYTLINRSFEFHFMKTV
nr:hypothetical protein [uncultured Acetatifactor sp.]